MAIKLLLINKIIRNDENDAFNPASDAQGEELNLIFFLNKKLRKPYFFRRKTMVRGGSNGKDSDGICLNLKFKSDIALFKTGYPENPRFCR